MIDIAPHYVNIEMAVLMDPRIPPAALHTYACLKALAVGKMDVTFDFAEFIRYFENLSRQTVYRHLALLATCAVLRYGSPGNRHSGLMHVEFLVDKSQKWDSLKNETRLITTTNDLLNNYESVEVEEEGGVGDSLKNETVPKMRQSEICRQIFRSITTFVTYPRSADVPQVELVIWSYYQEAGENQDAAAEMLMPYWIAWRDGIRLDGKPYSRTNLGWLMDWAVTKSIPDAIRVVEPEEPSLRGRWNLSNYAQ